MKKIIFIAILLASCISMQAQVDRTIQPKAGPAPKVNLSKPKSFVLPNGLTLLVVENHKLPRVTFTLTLDNPPSLEGDLKGVDDLASSMMGNGTSKINKETFNEQIDYYGASVYFSVHNISGSTLSRYFPQVLSLAAQGGLDPLLTQDELDSERAKLLDDLKADEKSPQSIARRVRSVLLYGKNHPKGEYLNNETINKVTLADVKDYYKKYFVPQNAYLVVVGDVKFDDVKKLVTDNFSSWKKAPLPKITYSDPVNLTKAQIDFVDVPNAVQSEISVNNIVNLKMTDTDYFAAVLANYILGGGGDGRLFLNLREAHGWTYGAYSNVYGNKYTSDFSASTSVRNAVTDSAVVEILSEINKIRTELPSQEELDVAKAKFIGSFVMNAEKPQTIASFALREKTQSLPANFYENYIKNVNAVTLQQLQNAAKKYFFHDNSRIVIAGKASDVLPGLERLNIPIKYYDAYGNPAQKPEAQKVSNDVTAKTVLEKYINAIGGQKALSGVKSIVVTAGANIQGNPMSLVQKTTSDGKSTQEMTMMGMTITKVVFDGTTGYMLIQGQRKDFEQSELDEMKYTAPFPELLYLNAPDVKLKGIEDGAYVVEIGNIKSYYDVNTGLKTANAVAKEMAGQTINQKVYYSDYKDVNGIKFPFISTMNAGGMEIEMKVSDIKINEGVTDADFQ